MITLAQKCVVGHMLHCGSVSAVSNATGNMQAVGCESEDAAAWIAGGSVTDPVPEANSSGSCLCTV